MNTSFYFILHTDICSEEYMYRLRVNKQFNLIHGICVNHGLRLVFRRKGLLARYQ